MAVKKQGKRKKCRNCDNLAFSREVCQRCGSEGRQLVHLGLFTDDELVERGFWAAQKQVGRPKVNVSPVVAKLIKTKTR